MESSRPIQAAELFEHSTFLRRLAQALLHDPQRAEDAVQEAFVAALEHAPRRDSLRSWLATVVRHRAINASRAERRRADHESRAARAEAVEGEDHVQERLELQRLVSEAVLALDEPRRTVVYLRYYEGLMPQAIADRLGAPLKTVKSHLYRALEELRRRLDERCGGDRRAWAAILAPLARTSASPRRASSGAAKRLAVAAVSAAVVLVAWRLAVPSSTGQGARTREPRPVVIGTADTAAPNTLAISPPAVPTRQPVAAGTSTAGLEVHLRWADGEPAAGVGVDAQSSGDLSPRETRARASTGADGVARFTDLEPGTVELRLDRTATFTAEAVAGETRTVELAVPGGADVEGRVVSSSGAPVAGAELWIEDVFARLPDPWPAGRSGADGSFRLRAVGMRVSLVARARDHQASQKLKLYTTRPDARGVIAAELVLPEGGQGLDGVVQAPDGTPVAGAVVWIGSNSKGTVRTSDGRLVEQAGSAWTTTDAEGRFASPNLLAPDIHDVVVLARGFPTWKGDVEVEDAPATLDVRLEPARTLAGSVTARDGTPGAGARIRALPASGDSFQMGEVAVFVDAIRLPPLRAFADEEGFFSLGWVGSGALQLVAEVPGQVALGRGRLTVDPARDTTRCDLALDPEPRIEGRVVDASGHGLAGWSVAALSTTAGLELRETKTGSGGEFALYGLDDVGYEVHATAPGTGVQPTASVSARAGTVGLELVVAAAPVRSARVHGKLLEHDGRVPTTAVPMLIALENGIGARLVLDPASGEFAGEPKASGHYLIQAKRGERVVAAGEPFEVAEGATIEAGTLTIPEAGALEVRRTGAPSASFSFRLERPGFQRVILVGEGDVHRATELAPGSWRLVTGAGDAWAPEREVVILPGETLALEVELRPATALLIDLDVEDPASLNQIVIEARDRLGTLLVHEASEKNSLPWPKHTSLVLPPGEVLVEVRTGTGLRASASTVVGNETSPEPLVLRLR